MARVQPGITLPEKLWKKAKENYGSREASKKVEKLIAEDLEDAEYQKSKKLLDLSGLSEKRKEFLLKLIEKDNFPYTPRDQGKIARNNGIYTSSTYVKKAAKVFDNNDKVPVKTEGKKIISDELDCECGSTYTLDALRSLDWECKQCGIKYEVDVK